LPKGLLAETIFIDATKDFRHSPAGKESYSLRSQTIEYVIADTKEKHGMRYTLHKGLDRMRNWIRLKFAAMNLKKTGNMYLEVPFFTAQFSIHTKKTPISGNENRGF